MSPIFFEEIVAPRAAGCRGPVPRRGDLPRGAPVRPGSLRIVAFVLALVAAVPAGAADIVLSNPRIEIRIDGTSGSIRQARNVVLGLDLVTHPEDAPAFVLTTSGGSLAPDTFTATRVTGEPGDVWDLAWSTSRPGVTVEARVALPPDADDARFTFRVVNDDPALGIESLEYPVIAGVETLLPAAGTDVALQPAAQGYLFRSPATNLPAQVVTRLYPDGYAGASLQTSAYYREGQGGFALEARDASATAKRFAFYREPATGRIRWSIRTLAWDRSAGTGPDPGYEVRLAALVRGDWEEAAERYRAWALTQWWAARGRVETRPDAVVPRWLYTTAQAATFGVSINLDQSRWFRALHDWVGGPLLHVSGFWWPGGTTASEWYGGYNDWSDGRVNPANLAAIRERGDLFAPFLFDLHFSRDATEWDAPAPDPATDAVAPWQPYEMIPDPESAPWAYMCPATEAWQAFHGWRDLALYGLYGYDATYYDIGAGLGRVRCDVAAHGHPPGSGRAIVDGYRAMLARRRGELDAAAGRKVAAGTELISELYLDRFDFYQARAEASVMSMLEGDEFRSGEKAGWAEKVPLFAYVYHDVGPVRLDGNLKAASQFGAIYYWIAARVVAWGGLPELNYELSALEKFPGMNDTFTWYETYKDTFHVVDTSPYASAADRGAYLGRLGRARTGFARPWLAYGRMARRARITSEPAAGALDWHLYNTFNRATDTSTGIEKGAEYYEQGTLSLKPVVHQAWIDGLNALGLFFIDTAASSANVTVEVDPQRHGLPYLNYELTRIEESGETPLGVRSGAQSVSLALASRVPVLLRARAAACTASTCLYRVFREGTAAAAASATTPLAIVQGHAWDDAGLADGIDRFYLVDDGGGFPPVIAVDKLGGAVHVAW